MCLRTLPSNEQGEGVTAVKVPPRSVNEILEDDDHPPEKFTTANKKFRMIKEELFHANGEMKEKINEDQSDFDGPTINPDLLAKSSVFLNYVNRFVENICQTEFYKTFFVSSQPAHIIMIVATLCVASALMPASNKNQIVAQRQSHALSFIYLAAFVMHFGAQIWMTFVSGLSLYFALPRHVFGDVQRVLFPRYFTMNACLSLITLIIFVKHHPIPTWDMEIAVQVVAMSSAFFIELFIRLYLTPPLLALESQKTTIERAAGVGNEVGRHDPGSLKNCPHYVHIYSAFRRVHITIAMGNVLTMGCTVLHLNYIASKLCVL